MLLARFLRSCAGNVAPTFALALLPVFGMVGAAVDYSRANSIKAAMQSALDSTALMLSRDAPTVTSAQLEQKANDYFKAMFDRPDAPNVTVTTALTTPAAGIFKLAVTGKTVVSSRFVQLLGTSSMTVQSTAEVSWGFKRLEVSLALDNTGSMAWHGKMVELKKAVKSLLDTLKNAAKKPDDIRVTIITFYTGVRIDTDYKNPPAWITFDSTRDKNTWLGCLEDRDQSHDVLDTPPSTGQPETLYPAMACSNNGALVKMRPLTNDWHALRLTVEQMNPNGSTNTTIGLVWAWHALTSIMPFTEASAPQPDLEKVIILLTDGNNTENRWTNSTWQIDARTKKACENIKAAGIKIYTVRVIEGNASLLKECASKPSMYFDVEQASQLNGVFSSIAQNLANLRISK